MNYDLIKDAMNLVQQFEALNQEGIKYSKDLEGFKRWIAQSEAIEKTKAEPDWEAKEHGRSAESVINTLIVHMNRYARNYSKSAIYNSNFSTQEDFIYLINLKAFGSMTKMELIKKNVQEKSVGMLTINRLIGQGFVDQIDSVVDKRSKFLSISEKGLQALEMQMDKVRKASEIVTGDLTYEEKLQLITLLKKMNDFHYPIYLRNLDSSELLDEVIKEVYSN